MVQSAYVSNVSSLLVFTGSKACTLAQELDKAAAEYRSLAFASSTKAAYKTHLKTYSTFCEDMGIPLVPITDSSLAQFAAYLAKKLSYPSIGKYLNIVRITHKEFGLDNPLQDNFSLDMVLKGIKRSKCHTVTRKLSITPQILLRIRTKLILSNPLDLLFWSTCLVAFFGLFRKSNLIPKSQSSFDPKKHLTVDDVQKCSQGLLLKIKWSKTIQYGERTYQAPLPYLKDHPLCPVTVLDALLSQNKETCGTPLFSIQSPPTILTHSSFVKTLRSHLECLGYPSSHFSGHSFRRGGATWAFQSGLPGEIIQSLGDWKSHAYLAYLELNSMDKFKYMKTFSTSLPTNTSV